MRIPTVAVNRGGVKVLINESDLTGDDTLWDAPTTDEKDELIEALAAHGIERDRRYSVGKLRKELNEVEQ